MGLFSFLKDAGAKLFNRKTETAVETETVPNMDALNAERAQLIKAAIEGAGFMTESIDVQVVGDTVTLSGEIENQADKEKVILIAGNIEGIAIVDDRMEVKNVEPEAVFYEVKSGDSLSKIAKAHYGDPMKYPEIFEANKPMLKDPNLIYPGQMLRIPNLKA